MPEERNTKRIALGFGAIAAGAFGVLAALIWWSISSHSSVVEDRKRVDELYQEGRFEEAVSYADRVVEAWHDAPSSYYLRAYCRFAAKDYEGALVDYRRAAELDPADPTYAYWYARILEHLDRDEEALVAAEHAIELDPHDAHRRYLYALVLDRLDRGDDALAALDRAIELDPAHEYAIGFRETLRRRELGY